MKKQNKKTSSPTSPSPSPSASPLTSPPISPSSSGKSKSVVGYVFLLLLGYIIGNWFPSSTVPDLPTTKEWMRNYGKWFLSVSGFTSLDDQKSICNQRRKIIEGVIPASTCERLMHLANTVRSMEEVGDELTGTNIQQLASISFTLEKDDLKLLNETRHVVSSAVASYFEKPVFTEYTHLTSRTPGKFDYSHGLHADKCYLDIETGACVERPESCCSWRSHSALLYLNDQGKDYKGGEFVFKDSLPWQKDDACHGLDTIIKPKCGTLVMFTSGKENVHGVNRVLDGTRYALAMWFTLDEHMREEDSILSTINNDDGNKEWIIEHKENNTNE